MKNRRSHYKSRSGCTNCKKRHVKCDEFGLPCANCISRGSADTCTYPNGCPNVAYATPTPSPPSSGRALQSLPKPEENYCRHLLELELMHRWSTSTYKGLCSAPEDAFCLQVQAPQWALKHELLLHGMYSLSALEAAITRTGSGNFDSNTYIEAALEYYNKGSSAFRSQLSHVTPENLHCLYLFSGIAVMINMAMLQCPPKWSGERQNNLLERISVLLELVYGWSTFGINYLPDLLQGPLAPMLQNYMNKLAKVDTKSLDEDSAKALDRLMEVVQDFASKSTQEQPLIQISQLQRAVQCLRFSFLLPDTDEVKGSMSGSLPILAGKGFSTAVKNAEPAALFVLLYWAVLASSLGTSSWWARSAGSILVENVAGIIFHSQPTMTREAVECVTWARMRASANGKTHPIAENGNRDIIVVN